MPFSTYQKHSQNNEFLICFKSFSGPAAQSLNPFLQKHAAATKVRTLRSNFRLARPKSEPFAQHVSYRGQSLEPFAQSASWTAQGLEPCAQKASAETKISNPVLKRRLERQKSGTLGSKPLAKVSPNRAFT